MRGRAKRTKEKKAPDSLGLQLPPYHILTFWLLMRPLPPSDLTGLNLTRSGSVQDPARLDQSLQARVWACDMQITTAAKMDSLLRRPRSEKTASTRQGRDLNLTRPDSPARCGDADLAAFLAHAKQKAGNKSKDEGQLCKGTQDQCQSMSINGNRGVAPSILLVPFCRSCNGRKAEHECRTIRRT